MVTYGAYSSELVSNLESVLARPRASVEESRRWSSPTIDPLTPPLSLIRERE